MVGCQTSIQTNKQIQILHFLKCPKLTRIQSNYFDKNMLLKMIKFIGKYLSSKFCFLSKIKNFKYWKTWHETAHFHFQRIFLPNYLFGNLNKKQNYFVGKEKTLHDTKIGSNFLLLSLHYTHVPKCFFQNGNTVKLQGLLRGYKVCS